MKNSKSMLAPEALRLCLLVLLGTAGMAIAPPSYILAQGGRGANLAKPGTRQGRPAPRAETVNAKAGSQGDSVADARAAEARLRDQIGQAVTKAENSGAAKYPETASRLSDVKGRAKSFETKLLSFSSEEILEQLSGTGEPVGEAKKIIEEANDIAASATNLNKPKETGSPDNQGRTGGGIDWLYWLGWLIWGLVGLLALGALAAFALFLFRLDRRVGDVERLHAKVVQRLKNMEGAVLEQKSQAQSASSGVTQLREELSREMEELRRSYRDMRAGPPRPVAPVAAFTDPYTHLDRTPARDPGPTFPALVSDYLSKVSDNKKVEVESDFRTNLFVPSPGGPFVLVQDDDGTGSGIVLPKSRLQKGQEFTSYYKGTYFCDSPSAGEVFVVEPAVVDSAGGGWRLRSPGRLELK